MSLAGIRSVPGAVVPVVSTQKGTRVGELRDVTVLQPRSGTVVVEFTGEHDLLTRRVVRDLFASLIEVSDLVVADISEAQFIDSSFVQTLLIADQKARAEGKRFPSMGTAPIVRRAIEMSHVLVNLEHANTREEALKPARG